MFIMTEGCFPDRALQFLSWEIICLRCPDDTLTSDKVMKAQFGFDILYSWHKTWFKIKTRYCICFIIDRTKKKQQQHLFDSFSEHLRGFRPREIPPGAGPGGAEETEPRPHGHPPPDGQTLPGEQSCTGVGDDRDSNRPTAVRLLHRLHHCHLHHHHLYLDLEQLLCSVTSI